MSAQGDERPQPTRARRNTCRLKVGGGPPQVLLPQPHHGLPTQEAEAGLGVVVAILTFRGGVEVQNLSREPLQGQIT